MKVAFYTLGCKLNQSETEALVSSFEDLGFFIKPLLSDEDLLIVNTCTVTTKSEQKARRIIRKSLRDNPEAVVIVSGCYAQVEKEALSAINPQVVVVINDEKDLLLDLPSFIKDSPLRGMELADLIRDELGGIRINSDKEGSRFRFEVEKYRNHSRAFLKIQDGCNNVCTYCRTRIARGKSVSLDSKEVVERVLHLESAGYKEVVITGINITAYKSGTIDFTDLINLILEATGQIRIRLSSLEPDSMNPRLIELFRHPRLCPHLHLPVQSGSDKVLHSMKRKYHRQTVLDVVENVRKICPDVFVAADIIVGFPGETDQEFEFTVDLVKKLNLAAAHIFPYSPRPGTEAFGFKHLVAERITKERIHFLKSVIDKSHQSYVQKSIGKTLFVVIEQDLKENQWKGVSENYLNVVITDTQILNKGDIYSVKVLSEENGEVRGIIE